MLRIVVEDNNAGINAEGNALQLLAESSVVVETLYEMFKKHDLEDVFEFSMRDTNMWDIIKRHVNERGESDDESEDAESSEE
jgi:hypothetical protein